ncbi:hypothetical protein PtB15_10B448 [Puccinia triticina]|nr:hypothetical protein PtB15_10B448 [Puccinia triticina]
MYSESTRNSQLKCLFARPATITPPLKCDAECQLPSTRSSLAAVLVASLGKWARSITLNGNFHKESSRKMLLKYLLAPIAFAMAAVPNEEASISKDVDFKLIVTVAEKFQKPIIAACNKNGVQEVINDLDEIYKPVVEISNKFHLIEKLGKNLIFGEARVFFGFIKVFEVILRAISQHSKVFDGTHQKLPEFEPKLDLIVSNFKKLEVDFHSALDGFRIDVALWARFGFKFQHKIGV